jgi:putative thiazole-containing bacteriocin maturation protein
MTNLTPAARLKVKGVTFFLPVPNDGVYFRNNVGTFRMKGEMIDRWIENLIPMFNGEYTLADLTDGMSNPHWDRVYEIADMLYQKGFVRDVSQDRSHQLTNGIIQKQILLQLSVFFPDRISHHLR